MAGLVPIPAAEITATYDNLSRSLELNAEGELSSIFLTPFFERDELWVGGLRFNLEAFSGGLGPAVLKPYKAETYKLEIILPQQHFNSKSVLVETTLGTFEIDINYKYPVILPEPQRVEKEKPVRKDVLPPIHKALPAGGQLIIRASVPTLEGFKAWVRPSFNKEYFKLVNTQWIYGNVTWTFEWNKLPTGVGENPQHINIITEEWNQLLGPDSSWSITVQGYIVTFIVFDEQK